MGSSLDRLAIADFNIFLRESQDGVGVSREGPGGAGGILVESHGFATISDFNIFGVLGGARGVPGGVPEVSQASQGNPEGSHGVPGGPGVGRRCPISTVDLSAALSRKTLTFWTGDEGSLHCVSECKQ